MTYRLIVLPEAEEDLSESFRWYEGKRSGLGFDFLVQVDTGLKSIERNPLVCSAGYRDTRKFQEKWDEYFGA